MLCGTFEALVAAIYLEAGLDPVRQLIEPRLAVAAEQILTTQRDQDAKSLLQERVQAQGGPPPQYQFVLPEGPEHEKTLSLKFWWIINPSVLARGTPNRLC